MESGEITRHPSRLSTDNEDTRVAKEHKRRYRLAVSTIFWCFFAFGINDGSLGPLIPAYQRYYRVRVPVKIGPVLDIVAASLYHRFSDIYIQLYRTYCDGYL
jgi:hypothetical protein